MKTEQLIAAQSDSQSSFANGIVHATGFWQRLRGLLGKSKIVEGEGMLIEPCSSVHTVAMRYPIDIVFIDKNNVITATHTEVMPNRFRIGPRGTVKTLELAANQIEKHKLQKHCRLNFNKTEENEK